MTECLCGLTVSEAVTQSVSDPIHFNSLLIFTILEAFVFVFDLSEHLWQAGRSAALIRAMASNNAPTRPDGFPFLPSTVISLISFPPWLKVLISQIRCCSVWLQWEAADSRVWMAHDWRSEDEEVVEERGRRDVHLLLINPRLHTVCADSAGLFVSVKHHTARQSPDTHDSSAPCVFQPQPLFKLPGLHPTSCCDCVCSYCIINSISNLMYI